MAGKGIPQSGKHFGICRVGGKVVYLAGVVPEVEEHLGRMRQERQVPCRIGVVPSEYEPVPCLVPRHAPLIVVAHCELSVRDVCPQQLVSSVGGGSCRGKVVQVVGCERIIYLSSVLVREPAHESLALHVLCRPDAGKAQDGRCEIGKVYKGTVPSGTPLRKMLPFRRQVYYERHTQPAFIEVAFPPREASSVVAEEEYYSIPVKSFVSQVLQEDSGPLVNVLDCLQMTCEVGPDFRKVGDIVRQS